MKVFIAHLFHETNSFAPGKSDFARFSTGKYCRGEEVRKTYAGTDHYIAGMLDRAAEDQVETVLSVSIGTAGPVITRDCLDLLIGQILEDLRACMPVDGLCLALHGAGFAEDVPDIEGHFLKILREEVGYEMPITASLDLHANISAEMLRLCDAMFSLKTYPHIDTHDAGYRAMDCLIRMLKTGKKPVMTAYRLPLMAAFTNMCTDRDGPGKDIRLLVEEASKRDDVYDVSFLHGFCYADIPDCGMMVLVVADGPRHELCLEIADFAWARREQMIPETVSAETCAEQAYADLTPGQLVIALETSDCGGGGGPNDGTFLLREMLKRDLPKTIFVSICDPEVAAVCYDLGVGAKFTGLLGGKADNLHGEPIPVKDAEILGISTGHFRYTTPMYVGQPYCVGKTVRLQIGNVEVVVNSVPRQTHDDRMIAITGSDISFYDLIGLKSGVAFKAFYYKLPQYRSTFACAPPGCSANDITQFHYEKVPRPMFPLDEIAEPVYVCLK